MEIMDKTEWINQFSKEADKFGKRGQGSVWECLKNGGPAGIVPKNSTPDSLFEHILNNFADYGIKSVIGCDQKTALTCPEYIADEIHDFDNSYNPDC
jgi:chromosome segregation ATPase